MSDVVQIDAVRLARIHRAVDGDAPHADRAEPDDVDTFTDRDDPRDGAQHRPAGRALRSKVQVASAAPLRLAEVFLSERDPMARYAGAYWQRLGGSTVYTTVSDEQLGADVYRFLDRVVVERETPDGVKREQLEANRRQVAEVLSALLALVPVISGSPPISDGGDIDPRTIVVTPSGLLDTSTRRTRAVREGFFATAGTSVSYDPAATAPHWLRFLGELWPDDAESIATLAEWTGYTLTGDTRLQKALMVLGPRRAGKGTIARILTALHGRANVAHPALGDFERSFGLAPLVGKSLAIIGDARLSGRADQAAVVERLLGITGEDVQTIDRKHRDAISVRLSTRIMLMSNEAPRLSDASSALASRFVVLELRRSFLGGEDLGLEDRLLGELPGILRWALDGLDRLRARGRFVQPESGKRAAEEIETLGSPHRSFGEECLNFAPGLETPCHAVYTRWRSWCEENGIREPRTLQVFSRDLRSAYPDIRDAQRGPERRRWYIGLGVRS